MMYNVTIRMKTSPLSDAKMWLVFTYQIQNGHQTNVSKAIHKDIKEAFKDAALFKRLHGDENKPVYIYYKPIESAAYEHVETDGQMMAIILRDG